MNVKGIKRAKDLHFEVPEELAEDIDRLIAAMESDDIMLDCYMSHLEGGTRLVDDEYGQWLYNYYLLGGWQDDVAE